MSSLKKQELVVQPPSPTKRNLLGDFTIYRINKEFEGFWRQCIIININFLIIKTPSGKKSATWVARCQLPSASAGACCRWRLAFSQIAWLVQFSRVLLSRCNLICLVGKEGCREFPSAIFFGIRSRLFPSCTCSTACFGSRTDSAGCLLSTTSC